MYNRIIIIISYLRCTTGSTTSWWGCWSAHASATWSTSKARCSTRTETMTSAQHHHDHFHHIYHHLHIIVIIIAILICSSFCDRGLESKKLLCQMIVGCSLFFVLFLWSSSLSYISGGLFVLRWVVLSKSINTVHAYFGRSSDVPGGGEVLPILLLSY